MHQVTLGGPAMKTLPSGHAGAYIKLLLKQPGLLLSKPLMRTYTIRAQREGEIDVQFALHGSQAAGPATQWALDSELDDTILVGGPGPIKPFLSGYDFHLIAGDMSALPAISANLETMPRNAKGVAVLEIQDEADAVAIAAPDGIDLQWVVNPEPGAKPSLLADTLRAVTIPEGKIASWVACEFGAMKEVRGYLRDELQLGAKGIYTSSYWKLGLNEGDHKVAKRKDAAAQPA